MRDLWEPTTVLRGGLGSAVRDLKSAPGNDIVTTGSITPVHALIAAGLVDEYRLFVHPVVLRHGRRLFADATGTAQLRLAETRPFHSGIALLRYRTAWHTKPSPGVRRLP
ncbi:dihydrofolate reductase family protein [Streptomyces nigrescens]